MVNAAYVHIWGKRVAAIAWDQERQAGSLEFDSSYSSLGWDLSPIHMPYADADGRIFSFPELSESSTFQGLPGLLADILPDKYGNALINTWLARQGRPADSLNPVEKLCFIGKRGMGALEISPSIAPSQGKATQLELESLIEVTKNLLSGREQFSTQVSGDEEKALIDILKIGTSAGGARAKAVIAYNPKTNEVRSGQANAPKGFSHWLIKFDGVHDQQFGSSSGYGRVEMAYYLMAQDAGIDMMPCRLLEENGRAHFMTQRFDRLPDGDKLHVQSFCALRHYDFNDVHLYSYEDLFETMRTLRLPYPDAEQQYLRMVFNVMARNCDDHTKNFAFTMNKEGEWRISPAFDICHAYRPASQWVSQHSLSLNGKRKDITREDLLTVAHQMNIKKPKDIIDKVAEVVSNWKAYADQVKVEPVLRDAIEKTLWVV